MSYWSLHPQERLFVPQLDLDDGRGWRDAYARLFKRVTELEAALGRVADEPNIDKARAIADAVLSRKR